MDQANANHKIGGNDNASTQDHVIGVGISMGVHLLIATAVIVGTIAGAEDLEARTEEELAPYTPVELVRLGDPEEPASAVLRRPTEEAVLLVARNREHMELRLKCDLIKAWLLAPEEVETLDSNLEQLDLLSKEYEEKRAELTAQQREMVEAEITRMRRICCPDKLLAAAEAKRDAHEAAEAERRKLEKKKQSGSIFASGFADRGIIRSVQSTA